MGLRKAVEIAVDGVKKAVVELRSNGRHDLDGLEHLDSTPVAVPLRFQNLDPVVEAASRLLASQELARRLAENGIETEEEANDFDVSDDMPIPTPWEVAGNEVFDELVTQAKAREKEKANGTVTRSSKAHNTAFGRKSGESSGSVVLSKDSTERTVNLDAPEPQTAPAAAAKVAL